MKIIYIFTVIPSILFAQEIVETTINTQVDANIESSSIQQEIDKLDERSKKLYFEYKDTLNEYNSLKRYDDQLSNIINSQIKEIENINNQIESLDTINIDVLPLLDSMVNSLEKFISFDIPFLIEERQARVNELNELLSRADISTSEKFRKIFEAYQIEANFGRTIEAYSSYIDIKGEAKAVEFFRLGRIGLFYRTLDGNDSGYWNSNNSSWEHVGSKLSDSIKSALDVANRKTPPNFITLPIKPIN